MKEIKRGEIYAVDFGTGFGSEQGGTRPSLILQNDIGNRHSPTTIVGDYRQKNKSSSAHPCENHGERA